MGLFGGKKTYVASTVYNMAGPEEERIDYLKTVVNSGIISNTKFSMGDVIFNNYLNGPGITTRAFHRWAKRPGNYDQIGIPEVDIYSPTYNTSTISANIPVGSGETATLQSVKYGPAEYSYWAEQYVMLNHQNQFQSNWTADYDVVTNTITITWFDDSTTSFNPTIDFGSNYYYVVYGLKNSSNYLGAFMWIYEVGSGNAAMDAMPIHNPLIGEFLPFIPIRIKNQFLSSTYKPEAYAIAKKAYKKATGGKKLDDLIEMIADNESIDDIDHAYMVYGVSLNAIDRSARRYLFKFFEFLMTAQINGAVEYEGYETEYTTTYQPSYNEFFDLRESFQQRVIEDEEEWGNNRDPAYHSPPAPVPGRPINEILIKSSGPLDTKLNMVIKWDKIEKTSGSGLKAGHKKGDVWWDDTVFLDDRGGAIPFLNAILSYVDGSDEVTINWQKTSDYWESITITGLVHKNLIYDGKSVDIRAGIALADADESGFIVPIHYETMRELSLIDSTQMMTCGTYLIFNSYEVVKQKWYQTAFFKVFVFVAMIAITVATMGAAAPGLLGAAGSVGASLGFSGLLATIVGAVANALAALILTQLLSVVSTAVFGAKFGAIIATVATALAMSFGSSLMSGMSMSAAWGNLMSAVNIINMTSAVGSGVSGYMQAAAAEWQGKSQELLAEYEKASEQIQQMWIKEFGQGDFHFDPTQLTNFNPGGVAELPGSFLDRTLMTGSDIAEMTNGMLSDFASLTLDVDAIRS